MTGRIETCTTADRRVVPQGFIYQLCQLGVGAAQDQGTIMSDPDLSQSLHDQRF